MASISSKARRCRGAWSVLSQSLLHHVEHALTKVVHLRRRQAPQRPFDDEQGETVYRGPCEILGAGSPCNRQRTRLDQTVEHRAQDLKWIEAARSGHRRVGRARWIA